MIISVAMTMTINATDQKELNLVREMLYEAELFSKDIEEYKQRRRQALLEAMMVVRSGQWRISGRVISVWAFQRSQKQKKRFELAG